LHPSAPDATHSARLDQCFPRPVWLRGRVQKPSPPPEAVFRGLDRLHLQAVAGAPPCRLRATVHVFASRAFAGRPVGRHLVLAGAYRPPARRDAARGHVAHPVRHVAGEGTGYRRRTLAARRRLNRRAAEASIAVVRVRGRFTIQASAGVAMRLCAAKEIRACAVKGLRVTSAWIHRFSTVRR